MTPPEQGASGSRVEVAKFSAIEHFRGLPVVGRCFAIRSDSSLRYEIVLSGFGQCATIDVAAEEQVPAIMTQAMRAFAETRLLSWRPYTVG